MKCSRCGVNEASVHVLEVKGSQKDSYWLCAPCAVQMQGGTPPEGYAAEDAMSMGAVDPDFEPGSGFLLGQLFELVQDNETQKDATCPGCGLTWLQFRESNKLGCARCYQVFRRQLHPLLERLQGRVCHVGRLPGEGGQQANLRREPIRLRAALEEAVAREDYEEAARLRDRLRQMSTIDKTDDQEPEG